MHPIMYLQNFDQPNKQKGPLGVNSSQLSETTTMCNTQTQIAWPHRPVGLTTIKHAMVVPQASCPKPITQISHRRPSIHTDSLPHRLSHRRLSPPPPHLHTDRLSHRRLSPQCLTLY